MRVCFLKCFKRYLYLKKKYVCALKLRCSITSLHSPLHFIVFSFFMIIDLLYDCLLCEQTVIVYMFVCN